MQCGRADPLRPARMWLSGLQEDIKQEGKAWDLENGWESCIINAERGGGHLGQCPCLLLRHARVVGVGHDAWQSCFSSWLVSPGA